MYMTLGFLENDGTINREQYYVKDLECLKHVTQHSGKLVESCMGIVFKLWYLNQGYSGAEANLHVISQKRYKMLLNMQESP